MDNESFKFKYELAYRSHEQLENRIKNAVFKRYGREFKKPRAIVNEVKSLYDQFCLEDASSDKDDLHTPIIRANIPIDDESDLETISLSINKVQSAGEDYVFALMRGTNHDSPFFTLPEYVFYKQQSQSLITGEDNKLLINNSDLLQVRRYVELLKETYNFLAKQMANKVDLRRYGFSAVFEKDHDARMVFELVGQYNKDYYSPIEIDLLDAGEDEEGHR